MAYEYRPLGPYDHDYVPYGGYTNDGNEGITLFQFMGDAVDRYMTFEYAPKFSRYGVEEIACQCVNVMEGLGGGANYWGIHGYVIEPGQAGFEQVQAMLWGWVELSSRELVRRYKKIFPDVIDEYDSHDETFDKMISALEETQPEPLTNLIYGGPSELDNGNWLFFEGWLYDDYPDMVPPDSDWWNWRDEEALEDFRAKRATPRPW